MLRTDGRTDGRTHARTDNVKTVYPLQTKFAGGIKNVHMCYIYLSYDVAPGSEITPCNKICKPLVVYRFTGNFMTSITTLRT